MLTERYHTLRAVEALYREPVSRESPRDLRLQASVRRWADSNASVYDATLQLLRRRQALPYVACML